MAVPSVDPKDTWKAGIASDLTTPIGRLNANVGKMGIDEIAGCRC